MRVVGDFARILRMRLFKRLGLLVTLAISALALVGCGSSSGGATIDTTGATIIDVRTAAEYAGGHLQGAVNIDVQSADFASKIAALPKDGKYIVYCQSGMRAKTAQAQMNAAGFTDVTNAGGIAAASTATGLPIVKS